MKIHMVHEAGKEPAVLTKMCAKAGKNVRKGETLVEVTTEAGERKIVAPFNGVIREVYVAENDKIQTNQELMILDEEEKDLEADVLVIGAGPGGYVAAVYAAKHGFNVVLVEKEHRLGGTCLNVGCIPTKALVRSANVFHIANNLEQFGVNVEGHVVADIEAIMNRKDQVVYAITDHVRQQMEDHGVNVITGHASFVSQHEVAVTGEANYHITADHIIIATGSRVSIPPIPGVKLPCVLDSTKALALRKLPNSITIVGGGVIGMEFAFIYRQLGVEVNVIQFQDRILTTLDFEVTDEITRQARNIGIKIYTGCRVKEIQQLDNGEAKVIYDSPTGRKNVYSEKVLVAIGRAPNIDGLCLENAGVELRENGRGIQVDEGMHTNVPHIYAIGDVNQRIMLAHAASHQGLVAVKNIMNRNVLIDESAVPSVIFTAPEVVGVGLSEQECRERDLDYCVGRHSFANNGKALALGDTKGFVKLISDPKTDKMLGGFIIGADAPTLVAVLTVALQNGMTARELRATIFAHPTTAEVIHEAAMDLETDCIIGKYMTYEFQG